MKAGEWYSNLVVFPETEKAIDVLRRSCMSQDGNAVACATGFPIFTLGSSCKLGSSWRIQSSQTRLLPHRSLGTNSSTFQAMENESLPFYLLVSLSVNKITVRGGKKNESSTTTTKVLQWVPQNVVPRWVWLDNPVDSILSSEFDEPSYCKYMSWKENNNLLFFHKVGIFSTFSFDSWIKLIPLFEYILLDCIFLDDMMNSLHMEFLEP